MQRPRFGWLVVYLLLTGWLPFCGAVLVAVAPPGRGTLVGLGLCLLWAAAIPALLRRKPLAVAALGAALLLLVLATALSGSGRPPAGSPVEVVYLAPGRAYDRFSLAHVVPEADQLLFGLRVFGALDALLDAASVRRMDGAIRRIYRELDADPHFAPLGSQLGGCYRELARRSFDDGHAYVYVPPVESLKERKLPVLLFLHGSLGNFKGYLQVWKPLADRLGFAVVAPSFGAGMWDEPGGREAVARARDYIATRPELDDRRVILGAISNGGRGLMLEAAAAPERYRALLAVSPVLSRERIARSGLAAKWKGRPMLVLTGGRDNRTERGGLEATADFLRKEGVAVRFDVFDDEDHFLFFTRREDTLARVERWLPAASRGLTAD